jgi:hypothetical protein
MAKKKIKVAKTEISEQQQMINEIANALGLEPDLLNYYNLEYNFYLTFLENYLDDLVFIEDKDTPGIIVDFKLWDAQKKVLEIFKTKTRMICLKSRQLGLTWLALAYVSHMLVFNSGKTATGISQTESDSKELIRRLDFILRHLPTWLIVSEDEEPEEKAQNVTGITFKTHVLSITINHPNKQEPSKFKGITSSPGAARSFTDNLIILDEWAFHPEAEAIWTAAYPTINRPGGGGQVIGISTAERGTLFESIWDNATWEFGAEVGGAKNTFTGIFLPWSSDPRRDKEWYEQTKKDLPNTYRAEYPGTPSEAFTVGKGAFFPEWDPDIHIAFPKGWYPPSNWRIVIAYDGGYNRSACLWFAISNDGWAVAYREYYPSQVIDPLQAENIKQMSKDDKGAPEVISYVIADTSCWSPNQYTGESTKQIMESYGIRPWRQADKEHVTGWRNLHEWLQPLKNDNGEPILDCYGKPLARLRFTESCGNTLRLFPSLKSNEHKPDDIALHQEDHPADCCRYFVQSLPKANIDDKTKKKLEERRKKRIRPRSKVTGY